MVAGAGAALCLALFFSFRGLSAGASPGGSAIGVVESVVSEARRRGDGTLVWSPVRDGSALYEGDALFVGEDSEAVVRFADGSRLEVEPSSLVVLRTARRAGPGPTAPPTMEVVRGAAVSTAGAHEVTVRARGAALGLRGGARARVALEAGGATLVEVATGQGMVTTAQGASAVAADHRLVIGADGKPAGPARELGPRLASPPDGARVHYAARRPDVTFRWAAATGGGPYRFELGRDPGLRDLVASRATGGLEHTQPALGPGVYYWRVTTGAAGGAAASASRRFAVVAERAPVLYEPRGAEVVQPAGAALRFSWTVSGEERDYVLALDRDERFAAARTTPVPARRHHAITTQLPEGRHCARVRHAARPDAPWSAPRCFELLHKARLGAPQLLDPTIDRGRSDPRGGERGEAPRP